jgi:tRNA dimethylallyltransferase
VAKQKVLSIVGPTGVGKTALSVILAKKFNGEIISADSMQVYRKMDIGTAKVTEEEKQGIEHYLVDVQDYSEPYNVKIFQEKCRESIDMIVSKNKFPIICGGTGLYLKAAMYDYDFKEEEEDTEYLDFLRSKSDEELYEMLQKVDEKSLEKIHPNNRKRIIRALMIAHTGEIKSEREAKQEHKPIYDVFFLGLDVDRELLHERINTRVDKMFDAGLVEEVTELFQDPATWEYTSFQGIGYKEFKDYFENVLANDTINQIIISAQKTSNDSRKMKWSIVYNDFKNNN